MLNVLATRKRNAARILTMSFGLKTLIASAKTTTKHAVLGMFGRITLTASATNLRNAALMTFGLLTRIAFVIATHNAASTWGILTLKTFTVVISLYTAAYT